MKHLGNLHSHSTKMDQMFLVGKAEGEMVVACLEELVVAWEVEVEVMEEETVV